MNFQITFIDGEQYELDYDKALELVMEAICKDNGWEGDYDKAIKRQKRLEANPSDIAEELHHVPFADVIDFLEPCPLINSILEAKEMAVCWERPNLTEIKLIVENTTLSEYGW